MRYYEPIYYTDAEQALTETLDKLGKTVEESEPALSATRRMP